METYTVRIADWRNDSQVLHAVREAVFIREQGVPAELEWDEFDAGCIHLIARDAAQKGIGTARLFPHGVIGRMAVLKEWRGKGVGATLMHCLLEEAIKRQIQQVVLHAQAHAGGFYARFGFRAVGKQFMEAGIPHVRMVLRLAGRSVDQF
ncbi:GNAT family N-acetyltransferase [Nitrosovibrio tenuis]|uniref:GNAT family N-acetyltransferase n=1 Tax=Nitrosovibrio tenuis TaxID=1233 RepID=UPI000B84AD51|nr:GNAT family N-acetyltransferase [Nitrosovibrio tenuis]